MAWGVDTAKHVTAATAVPVAFLTDLYGEFGRVTWIALYSDFATLDKAQATLAGDAAYAKRLEKAAELFTARSGESVLVTRVA